MKTNLHFWSYFAESFLEWEMSQEKKKKKNIKKLKTRILFSVPFFENRAVYEIMWKNIEKPDTPQMTMRRTHALHVGKLKLQTSTRNI